MLIEIRKAEFLNKGAELMLQAVLKRTREEYPDVSFAMEASLTAAPYIQRARLGLLQKVSLWYCGVQWGRLAALVPAKIRRMYGVVLDKDIDVVFDTAGFNYGDQWGAGYTLELANSSKRWKKNGTKIILLPQAFGPFTSKRIRKAINIAADQADLIFARDRISYGYLIGAVGIRESIKMAPDFTNLIEGILPEYFDKRNNRFCIIPNYRMIDKTSAEQSQAYLPFMIKCAQYLADQEAGPFILIHEGLNDLMLAKEISSAAGGLPIIKEGDPLRIKGILGACEGVLSSRFHGLVSALSQGVPALGTGWSHKYQMLFESYNFAEGMMNVSLSQEEIKQRLSLVIHEGSKQKIREVVEAGSRVQKQLSKQMWEEIFRKLNSTTRENNKG